MLLSYFVFNTMVVEFIKLLVSELDPLEHSCWFLKIGRLVNSTYQKVNAKFASIQFPSNRNYSARDRVRWIELVLVLNS